MADVELDTWICKQLGLTPQELSSDDLFTIIKYFYPKAEFCKDEKLVKEAGCAYILLDAEEETSEQAIFISEPTKSRLSQTLYSVVLAITSAYKNGSKHIELLRYY